MSILTIDQETIHTVGGEHNVLRYAQAHDLQLITVNYPLDPAEMSALSDTIARWIEGGQDDAPPPKKTAAKKTTVKRTTKRAAKK